MGSPRSGGHSKGICDDLPFPTPNVIRKYGAYNDFQWLLALQMKGNIASIGGVRFQGSGNTVVDDRKCRWWPCAGRGAPVSHCVSSGLDNPFLPCLEESENEKVLELLILAPGELDLSRILF